MCHQLIKSDFIHSLSTVCPFILIIVITLLQNEDDSKQKLLHEDENFFKINKRRTTNSMLFSSNCIEFEKDDGKDERNFFANYFSTVFPEKILSNRCLKELFKERLST
jgi:hypothetical protein